MPDSELQETARPPLTVALLIILIAVAAGTWYRVTDLDSRPMHNDEANQFGKLVDTYWNEEFEYDPHDHHGPTLIFSTIAARTVQGKGVLAGLDEHELRIIPAVYGVLLILTLLLLVDGLGRIQTAVAGLILACSPIFVYFSRYYIMELPLVVFTSLFIGFGWRYFKSGKLPWALAAGISAGLMHVTKETAAVAWLATACWMLLAGIAWTKRQRSQGESGNGSFRIKPLHYVLAVLIGVTVSAALFSTLFKNWQAVKDSYLTYFNYAERAQGAGHEKPWFYYLQILTWYKNSVLWSELPVVILGLVGMAGAVFGKGRVSLPRFLTVYTLVSFAIYSAFAYKTPWTILPAYFGLVLLAGCGAVSVIRLFPSKPASLAAAAVMAAGILGWFHLQNHRANGEYSADERNPYVYTHTSPELVTMADTILGVSKLHPEKNQMPITVYKAPEGGWPLPWYLRYMQVVDYFNESFAVPVIVVGVSEIDNVLPLLTTGYHQSRHNFRPGAENDVFLLVEQSLWNRYEESRMEP